MTDAEKFIQTKQTCWALRRGITIVNGSKAPGVEKNYTTTLKDNLFMPLAETIRASFLGAQGRELGGKMLALGSSSALAVNLFAYWNHTEKLPTIAEVLGLPSPTGLTGIQFESIHPIIPGSVSSPNLDAEFVYAIQGNEKRVFVECKLLEPYRDATKATNKKYFECGAFDDLPHCRTAAEKTLSRESRSKSFNAMQALTHILGVKRSCGSVMAFTLIYLWCDVPGPQGAIHAAELQEFAATVAKDGIHFREIRLNEFLVKVAKLRSHHPDYVDYITDRYL